MPIETPEPIPPLPPPTLVPTRRANSDDPVKPLTTRRRRNPIPKRAGTLVTSMVISLDSGRIALLSPEGPPVYGDVDTDLNVGSYYLKTDAKNKQWVFEPQQVKSGQRFRVALDGANPFDLIYVPAFVLTVTRGLTPSGTYSLESICKLIDGAVYDQDFMEAFLLLDTLNTIDLYDVVEDLWYDKPGVINALLLHFRTALKTQQFEMTRILLALESVAIDPKYLFIDAFDSYRVHPKSFSRDIEREKAGKTNIMIIFQYELKPERAIIVYADDILDTDDIPEGKFHYAEGCLLYPPVCTRGITPRMWQAKKTCIDEIYEGLIDFIKVSQMAVSQVIDLVLMTNSLLNSTLPLARRSPLSMRPISRAFEMQSGRWLHDFEGGTNMSEAAAAYEARVCNKTAGIGFYVKGVQFDGIENEVLLDAKYYVDNGRMTKSLLKNNHFVGMKLVSQGQRQVMAAGTQQVEWRVASQAAAGKIQQLFQTNKIPIRVVFVP